MTREEIEQKMDELARKYVETHDQKIIDELYELACQLEKLEELGKAARARPRSAPLRRHISDNSLRRCRIFVTASHDSSRNTSFQ